MGRVIGIDLGTTNSCVAVLEGGEPTVIHNQEGGRTTPSMASWNADGDVVVGAASKRQMVTNPQRTVFGAKRLIGRKFHDREVQSLISRLPYSVVPAKNGDAWVEVAGTPRSPQEISAHVLAKMKRLAVFDLGGGTFDISILAIENGVFEVLATHGDTSLGGDDFDRVIIDLLADEFAAEHGINLRTDSVALQRLKEAAERAKIELSSAMTTDVNLPFIAAGPGGPVHLMRELERGQLERACRHLIDRLDAPCQRALADAHCTPADIDQVLLVGGMSRMPAVQERAVQIFGKPASKGVNPDEIVAMGAAVHSGIMGGELQEVVLLDVTPHDMGVKVAGDRMSVVITANTSIPTRAKKIFATTEDNQTYVAIEIYQGEHELASRNRRLGRFILGDLKPAPRGVTKVEVSFTMDADGILEVTAAEVGTGRAASVQIEASSGLTAEEIQRLGQRLAT